MLNKSYLPFYLEGRNAKPLKHELDVAELANQVLKGESPPKVALAAVMTAAEPLYATRHRARWVGKHEAGIATAGGDADAAYRHFVQGRLDELAAEIDALICEELEGEEDADEDNDEEDDEEEDDSP